MNIIYCTVFFPPENCTESWPVVMNGTVMVWLWMKKSFITIEEELERMSQIPHSGCFEVIDTALLYINRQEEVISADIW